MVKNKIVLSFFAFLALVFLAGCSVHTTTEGESLVQEVKTNKPLLGTKWKLIEVMGTSVDGYTQERYPFLSFSDDSSFSGMAGCNNFFGKVNLDEKIGRISFSRIGSTMMACDQTFMETERMFFQALERVDNYVVNGDILMLNRARMAPLAKFRAVE